MWLPEKAGTAGTAPVPWRTFWSPGDLVLGIGAAKNGQYCQMFKRLGSWACGIYGVVSTIRDMRDFRTTFHTLGQELKT